MSFFSTLDTFYVTFCKRFRSVFGWILIATSLALSQVVKIVPPPTRWLLAKYNISFYDALGRQPRVLDYECFVSYKARSDPNLSSSIV
jgi:hypothetical protein